MKKCIYEYVQMHWNQFIRITLTKNYCHNARVHFISDIYLRVYSNFPAIIVIELRAYKQSLQIKLQIVLTN